MKDEHTFMKLTTIHMKSGFIIRPCTYIVLEDAKGWKDTYKRKRNDGVGRKALGKHGREGWKLDLSGVRERNGEVANDRKVNNETNIELVVDVPVGTNVPC